MYSKKNEGKLKQFYTMICVQNTFRKKKALHGGQSKPSTQTIILTTLNTYLFGIYFCYFSCSQIFVWCDIVRILFSLLRFGRKILDIGVFHEDQILFWVLYWPQYTIHNIVSDIVWPLEILVKYIGYWFEFFMKIKYCFGDCIALKKEV